MTHVCGISLPLEGISPVSLLWYNVKDEIFGLKWAFPLWDERRSDLI